MQGPHIHMWIISIGGKLWVWWDFGTQIYIYISVIYAEDLNFKAKEKSWEPSWKPRLFQGRCTFGAYDIQLQPLCMYITAWVVSRRHVRSLAMDAEEEKQSKTHIHGQLVEINHNQEKRIRHEETKAQNLTTGFAVVQVLILNTLVINKPSGRCERWWLPFSLSLSVGVIYFVTIFEVVKKMLPSALPFGRQLHGTRSHSSGNAWRCSVPARWSAIEARCGEAPEA